MPSATLCNQCRVSNPPGLKTCVNCGAALEVVVEAPAPPKTFRPLELKSHSPQHNSDIIPGRPPWMSIYALCLGAASITSLGALGFRLLNGTLFTTYSNFLIVAIVLAACISALPATIGLWRLRRTGLLLTLVIPMIFGRIRIRGGYSDRFEGILISGLGIALVGAFLLMFLALPITIFQPTLFEMVDLTWPVPGLLRLGLAGSIPVNLLFAMGLMLDQSRFQ